MKLTFFFIFSVIVTLQYNGVEGEFFGDLVKGVKDGMDKTRTGLRNIIRPKNGEANNKQTATPINGQTADGTKNSDGDGKKVETTTQAATTTNAPANTVTPIVAPGKGLNLNSTGSGGRENFAASCLDGYTRTDDGRCEQSWDE